MSIENRKIVWWLVLTSCASIASILLAGFIEKPAARTGNQAFKFLFVIEVVGAVVGLLKLKRCYAEQPLPWTGRWQLSLSDLLSIVAFFGVVLLIFYGIKINKPNQFSSTGVPISIVIGIGYSISLLCVARMGRCKSAVERWCYAFGYLIRAVIICAISIMCQCGAYGVVAIIVNAMFVRRN